MTIADPQPQALDVPLGRRAEPAPLAGSRPNWKTSVPFMLAHLVPLAAFWTGITWTAVGLFFVCYFGRVFFITGAYHRYFSHRSYKTSRAFQFVLAFGGTTAAQKGPLWWASHHRRHHRYSDLPLDVHSPKHGLFWSHVGWILCDESGPTDLDGIRDFAKYPELRFLNKYDFIGPWSLGIACFLIGGWSGLVVGFFGSTVMLWHGTFLVNSLAHLRGYRRFDTTDTSRNNWFVAFLTLGEGWHNNHHRYQASARNGFYRAEIDVTYGILKVLSWLHIVWDLKPVPAAILDEGRTKRRYVG